MAMDKLLFKTRNEEYGEVTKLVSAPTHDHQ